MRNRRGQRRKLTQSRFKSWADLKTLITLSTAREDDWLKLLTCSSSLITLRSTHRIPGEIEAHESEGVPTGQSPCCVDAGRHVHQTR